jgi:hypothetical protein
MRCCGASLAAHGMTTRKEPFQTALLQLMHAATLSLQSNRLRGLQWDYGRGFASSLQLGQEESSLTISSCFYHTIFSEVGSGELPFVRGAHSGGITTPGAAKKPWSGVSVWQRRWWGAAAAVGMNGWGTCALVLRWGARARAALGLLTVLWLCFCSARQGGQAPCCCLHAPLRSWHSMLIA